MNDIISVKDLPIMVRIGISEKERSQEQQLKIDFELEFDTRETATTDDITKTIDYRYICEDIHKIAQREYNTIETLAHIIAEMIKKNYPAQLVTVHLKKPRALEKWGASHAAITIIR